VQKQFAYRVLGSLKTAQWDEVLEDRNDLAKYKTADKSYQEEELCSWGTVDLLVPFQQLFLSDPA